MDYKRLIKTLKRHEGYRKHPYVDSVGVLSVGIGRNLKDVGISELEAETLLMHDIEIATEDAMKIFDDFTEIDSVRQEVIVNMIFNLGAERFSGFRKTIQYIKEKDYENASREMLNSKWAKQVGPRAMELSEMMRSGEIL